MVLDVPFSALADTFMVPLIAYHQWTDPPGTEHKSALQVAGEEMGKAVATEVVVPMTVEMMKTTASELQKQQIAPIATPVECSKD
jgi:hypothetical protein